MSAKLETFRRGLSLLERRQKLRLVLMLCLMLVASAVELLSVGAVLPFLAVLALPIESINPQLLRFLGLFFDPIDQASLRLNLTLLFISTVIVSGATRYLLLFFQARFSYSIANELSVKMFSELLDREFSFHTNTSTAELISATANKVGLGVFNVLLPVMLLSTAILSATAIAVGLFLMQPMVTLTVVGFVLSIYGLMFAGNKANINRMGRELNEKQAALYGVLQEGFAAIREIILYKKRSIYVDRYASADSRVKRILADSLVIGSSPRYLVETIGISAIAVSAYVVSSGQPGLAASIPVFGLFVFAAQRLLPTVQLMYQNIIAVKVGLPACEEVIDLFERNRSATSRPLHEQQSNSNGGDFRDWRELVLSDVHFAYPTRPLPVLRNCSLKVSRGDVVGIVGLSGGGKSTLMDVMMGLQPVSAGAVFVDGVPLNVRNVPVWQSQIAHVPQQVFLHEGSVFENVAFEVDETFIDRDVVRQACVAVGLDSLIATFPAGYDTRLGDRGSKLSGGQRQRLGIARALYRRASILFLDEATSALDDDSESLVLSCLESLKSISTIVMITHRPSTLSICNRILLLSGGGVSREFGSLFEYSQSRPSTVDSREVV